MKPNTHAGYLSALKTEHNIASVIIKIVPYVPVPAFRSHIGILAALGPTGSLPIVASKVLRSGLGGAYSISIPAAKSSARASIISSSNCISRFRELAIRLSRVSLNSANRPLCSVTRYSTSLRSRSSAVLGFRTASLPFSGPSAEWGEMNCQVLTYHKSAAILNTAINPVINSEVPMKGKRSAWLQMPGQLRVDPKLGEAVRAIAANNFRTPNAQILLWIYQGVQSAMVKKSGEKWGPKLLTSKGRA